MTAYELWVKTNTEKERTDIWLLEDSPPYKLFKLIETARIKNSNSYEYHYVNYHVWNTNTSEWFTSINYLEAYEYYNNRVKELKRYDR